MNLSTDAGYFFLNQVYAGIECADGPADLGLCPLAGATRIGVPIAQPMPIVADVQLSLRNGVFANGFD